MNQTDTRDLLARLVAARDAETGSGMTAKEVRDEVVTIFMAGHETTAQALTWSWYLLSLHPSVEAKLYEELNTMLNGRTPQYEDIANLRYTRMVIEELMRLCVPKTLSVLIGGGNHLTSAHNDRAATLCLTSRSRHLSRRAGLRWRTPHCDSSWLCCNERCVARGRDSLLGTGRVPCAGVNLRTCDGSKGKGRSAQRTEI